MVFTTKCGYKKYSHFIKLATESTANKQYWLQKVQPYEIYKGFQGILAPDKLR